MVPIENSVEGGVSAALDTLAALGGLQIVREVVIPVQFNLYVRPGTSLSSIRRVVTHPHAANQCRDWLAANLPEHAEITQGGSTASAAKEVSDPRSRFDAAVCAEVAGTMYGLTAVAQGIADNPDAVTRFILVARSGQMIARTGMIAPLLSSFPRAITQVPCWRSCSSSLSAKLICRELNRGQPRIVSVSTASPLMPLATSRMGGWLLRSRGCTGSAVR